MRRLSSAVAVTLVFALAGCGDGGSDDVRGGGPATASAPASAPASGSPSARLRSLPEPLKFEGTTLDGKSFTGANLAERPVVFWFWAPWCPKCQSEGPAVAAMAEKYQGRVAFVGIAGLDKSKDQMTRFVERTGTGGITQLDDRSGDLYKHFKVTSQSSFLFMKRDGSAERASGPLGEGALDERVRTLVGG